MPIRRITVDYETGMGVFWNLQGDNLPHRTNHAIDRFCDFVEHIQDIPTPLTRLSVINSRKVRYLPFAERITSDIAHVLLYGKYGCNGQVICWDTNGDKLPDELSQGFLPPKDVKNLWSVADLVFIESNITELYRRGDSRSL
jgi:hypothetical protein